MAVFKRFKGRRIKPGHQEWAAAKWWMEFTLRGSYVLQSIPGTRTQAQAERAESAIREDIYNNRFNKAAKTVRFSEFVEDVYLPWARSNKSSWRNDESRSKALKEFFGKRQIKDITPMMIRRLKNELLSERTKRFDISTQQRTLRKGTTVNRYLQLLSKILEMSYEEGFIDQNPMRRVPLEPEGEGRERYLTYAEEDRLLPQLTGRLAHLHAPIVVGIDTGMRVNSELLRLQIEHCNFSDSSIFFNINGRDVEVRPNHLLVVKSKNKRPRTIPMTERVRQELLRACLKTK